MFQKGQKPPTKRQASLQGETEPTIIEVQATNIEPTLAPVQIAETSPEPTVITNFTHSALGTFQDNITFRWKLVEFKFDPVTLTTKVESVTEMGDGRLELVERFKIRSVELSLV